MNVRIPTVPTWDWIFCKMSGQIVPVFSHADAVRAPGGKELDKSEARVQGGVKIFVGNDKVAGRSQGRENKRN